MHYIVFNIVDIVSWIAHLNMLYNYTPSLQNRTIKTNTITVCFHIGFFDTRNSSNNKRKKGMNSRNHNIHCLFEWHDDSSIFIWKQTISTNSCVKRVILDFDIIWLNFILWSLYRTIGSIFGTNNPLDNKQKNVLKIENCEHHRTHIHPENTIRFRKWKFILRII